MSEYPVRSTGNGRHQFNGQEKKWLKKFIRSLASGAPFKWRTSQISLVSEAPVSTFLALRNTHSSDPAEQGSELARLNRDFQQMLGKMNYDIAGCELTDVNKQTAIFKIELPAGARQQPETIVLTLMSIWKPLLSASYSIKEFHITMVQNVPAAVHREQFVPINLNPVENWVHQLIEQQHKAGAGKQKLRQVSYYSLGSFDKPESAKFGYDNFLIMAD